ncbi:MAG: hypothetical protein ACJ0G9_04170 [Alphaproteobacteria bacterium]
MEELFNWVFILATGIIAWHGITYKDKEGEKDFVRLLFGCIALIFFITGIFSGYIKSNLVIFHN